MSLFVASHGITVVVLNNLCKRLDLNSNYFFPESVNMLLRYVGISMVLFPFSGIYTNFVGFSFLVLIWIFLNLKKVSVLQFKIRRKGQTLHWELVLSFLNLYFARNHPSLSFQNDFKFPLHTSSNHVVNVILSFYKFPSSHYSQR